MSLHHATIDIPLFEYAGEAGQLIGPAADADLGFQHAALPAVDQQPASTFDRGAVVAPESCARLLAMIAERHCLRSTGAGSLNGTVCRAGDVAASERATGEGVARQRWGNSACMRYDVSTW